MESQRARAACTARAAAGRASSYSYSYSLLQVQLVIPASSMSDVSEMERNHSPRNVEFLESEIRLVLRVRMVERLSVGLKSGSRSYLGRAFVHRRETDRS